MRHDHFLQSVRRPPVPHRSRSLPSAVRTERNNVHAQIDRFVEHLKAQRLIARNTELAYRSDLQQFCLFLRDHGIDDWDVTVDVVREFHTDLERRYSKATTRARKLAAVKAIYRFLLEDGVVKENPARLLDLPTPAKRTPESLSRAQLVQLVDSADQGRESAGSRLERAKLTRDRAMLALLCATGLLASELVALDVDEQIVITGQVEFGKLTNRRRSVRLDEPIRATIETYLVEARPLLAKGATDPALFLNHHGNRLTRQGFWLIVKQCAKRAGIDGITPRLLRHSCATHKLTDGFELKDVQSLLGHAHLSTTQVYARVRSD